jgi:hypothetical protein
MLRTRTPALAIAAFATSVVLPVPALAQSGTVSFSSAPLVPLESDRTRTGVARRFYTDANSLQGFSLPFNLVVPPVFRDAVDAMLRRSPTFRRQCARLANAPRMVVVLDWSAPDSGDRTRARTVVSATTGGGRHAAVTIRSGNDPVELIAHELEHVLEQLDEIDLPALATVPASRVHGCDCGEETYETIRAIRAGQAAAAEVRGDSR